MKRILVLFIVTVMTVLLVACEGIFNTTPTDILTDGSTEADTRLYDIALEQMTVENGIDMSLVPDVTKKGIGTLKAGGFKLKSVSSPEHAAEVVIRFFDVKRDDYALLVSYYLENGGKTDDVIATS